MIMMFRLILMLTMWAAQHDCVAVSPLAKGHQADERDDGGHHHENAWIAELEARWSAKHAHALELLETRLEKHEEALSRKLAQRFEQDMAAMEERLRIKFQPQEKAQQQRAHPATAGQEKRRGSSPEVEGIAISAFDGSNRNRSIADVVVVDSPVPLTKGRSIRDQKLFRDMRDSVQGLKVQQGRRLQSTQSQINKLERDVNKLQKDVKKLNDSMTTVETKTACITETSGPRNVFFRDCNVHIQNGLDLTDTMNGRGNLFLGYNEGRSNQQCAGQCRRSGSHNLVIGSNHEYAGWAGVVSGEQHSIQGKNNAVVGGSDNRATANGATVVGGSGNRATGSSATVSGGQGNKATSNHAAVSGGKLNEATSGSASVSGGEGNIASGIGSSILGGKNNRATNSGETIPS